MNMWKKKEAEGELDTIVYSCRDYLYEYQIIVEEHYPEKYRVLWEIRSLDGLGSYSGEGNYYTSSNPDFNRTRAEFEANLLRAKLINETGYKTNRHRKKCIKGH